MMNEWLLILITVLCCVRCMGARTLTIEQIGQEQTEKNNNNNKYDWQRAYQIIEQIFDGSQQMREWEREKEK